MTGRSPSEGTPRDGPDPLRTGHHGSPEFRDYPTVTHMRGDAYSACMNRRLAVPAVVLLLSVALLVGQAATAPPSSGSVDAPQGGEGAYPGETLISVQAYSWFDEDNGQAFTVDRNGTRTWTYDPPNAWVFDAEALDNGNVLVSFGQNPKAENVRCPDRYYSGERPAGQNGCILNRVVEVDPDTNEVIWEHSWYDAFPTHHEVHDADRLPNGNTLVTDSRNFRVIEVGPNGSVVWSYSLADRQGIVYEADRLGPSDDPLAEEPDDVPAGGELESRSSNSSPLATVDSWLGFVFPPWVGVGEVLTGLVGLVAGVALLREGYREGWFTSG